jgi:hypothetical protein
MPTSLPLIYDQSLTRGALITKLQLKNCDCNDDNAPYTKNDLKKLERSFVKNLPFRLNMTRTVEIFLQTR